MFLRSLTPLNQPMALRLLAVVRPEIVSRQDVELAARFNDDLTKVKSLPNPENIELLALAPIGRPMA